jgi:hypothetical protein
MGRPRKRPRGSDDIAIPTSPANVLASNSTLDPFIYEGTASSIPWTLDQTSFLSYVNPSVDIAQSTPAQPPVQSNVCSCIVTTSSALHILQGLITFHFPSSLGNLRNIISSLASVVDCPVCPQRRATALQNNLLLQTTLSSIAERFQGLLAGLEDEYQRLQSSGERPELRFADPLIDFSLHTGTVECPMGFTLALDPGQWRELAHKSLMSLISGPGGTVKELINCIEKRQQRWHAEPSLQLWREHESGGSCWRPLHEGEDVPQCVANLRHILRQIELMV